MYACQIISLAEKDLAAITCIHTRAFPGRALTCLGEKAVARYYQTLLSSGQFRLAIGVQAGEDLLGYLFGGEIKGAMLSFLKRHSGYLLFHILTHPNLLTQPIVRSRVSLALAILNGKKHRARPKGSSKKRKKRTFSVVVIAVDPHAQRCGVGKLLMSHAEEVARVYDYEQMHLSVDVHNTNAVQFYEHLGWFRDREVGWHGGMVKPLAQVEVRPLHAVHVYHV